MSELPTLAERLLDISLVQFGAFVVNGEQQPAQFHMEMLPAYPDVLKQVIADLAQHLDFDRYDRILCTVDALPLGVALSLETKIPLVYSRGTNEPPVFDLVGAYDIGHPTLLVTNLLIRPGSLTQLITGAGRVGLQVEQVACILQLRDQLSSSDKPVCSLVTFTELVAQLVDQKRLPEGHARTVYAWIDTSLT